MFTGKRTISFLAILLSCFLLILIGFIFKDSNSIKVNIINLNPNQSEKTSPVLKTWSGKYTFFEQADILQNMHYSISIYKKGNTYLAEIYINGFQTLERDLTKVVGDEKSIKLEFLKYLPDNRYESYKKGDILLSFERKGSKLITKWGKIKPLLVENYKPGEYFKLETPIKK